MEAKDTKPIIYIRNQGQLADVLSVSQKWILQSKFYISPNRVLKKKEFEEEKTKLFEYI